MTYTPGTYADRNTGAACWSCAGLTTGAPGPGCIYPDSHRDGSSTMTEQTTLPCGGHAGDRLHHDDGTLRGTARSTNGRELEWFDAHARNHKLTHHTEPAVGGSPHPLRELVHAAADDGEGYCYVCGAAVYVVHGGAGLTAVHVATGAVAARTPAAVLAARQLVGDWRMRAHELSPDRSETYENDRDDEDNDATADAYIDAATALESALAGDDT